MKASFSLLSLLLGFALLPHSLSAEEIAAGQKLATLTTSKGATYEDVTVREVLPDGLKILFSGGVKTISRYDLPQYESSFAKVKEEAAAAAAAAAQKAATPPAPAPVPAGDATAPVTPATPDAGGDAGVWLPANNDDVAACSLFVEVKRGVTHSGAMGAWVGSAFLCNIGNATYIYSNAHNFDGAEEFVIHDAQGKIYDDFASIEIAGANQAFWKQTSFGGDVVRIRLRTFVPQALTIDPKPLYADTVKGRKIVITGNTGGAGKITQLEGLITSLAPDNIIIHNAATLPGNSGSPIVDTASHKVIGILTWGLKLDSMLEEIWSKQAAEKREGINVGAGLATIQFVPTTFEKLRQQRVAMNELKKKIRLLGLLDTLYPAKQGVFVNQGQIVMGDYTIADLIAESEDHPVVRELIRLDKTLQAKTHGSISISNAEMLKLWEGTMRNCLAVITSERMAMETTQTATFYMKCNMKRSRIIDICKAYEALCTRSADYFHTQQGSNGTAMSLAPKFGLPPIRSGLKGLGLRE